MIVLATWLFMVAVCQTTCFVWTYSKWLLWVPVCPLLSGSLRFQTENLHSGTFLLEWIHSPKMNLSHFWHARIDNLPCYPLGTYQSCPKKLKAKASFQHWKYLLSPITMSAKTFLLGCIELLTGLQKHTFLIGRNNQNNGGSWSQQYLCSRDFAHWHCRIFTLIFGLGGKWVMWTGI